MHPIFIVALLTIARTWNQPKCPSAEEWIKKTWYIIRGTNEPLAKQKWSHRCRNQICGYQRKKVGGAGRINCEIESDTYLLLYIG